MSDQFAETVDKMISELEAEKESFTIKMSVTKDRILKVENEIKLCLLYTSPSPRDRQKSRMPSSA